MPANAVRTVVPQLKTGRGVQHAYLGVSTPRRRPATAPRSATSRRARPAQRAGAEIGDLVTEVDGQAIASRRTSPTAIADNKPGDQITMKVARNGQERTLTVTLSDRPATAPSSTNP